MMPNCRYCSAPLSDIVADLGMSPLANAFVRPEQLGHMEAFYPLTAYVCARCFLVQVPSVHTPAGLFSDYAYFSSYSDSWLAHALAYCAAMRERLSLGRHSRVIEIASNDGYLLQHFQADGIPVLGIEPAANVAAVAQAKGIDTLTRFFGGAAARELADTDRRADLLLGNNVLAHVPDLGDFMAGLGIALAPGGTITMEVPHLLQLVRGHQFDTIYHEHFSYFSLLTMRRIFSAYGLTIVDVDELPTHGGSLRIYARHAAEAMPEAAAVDDVLQQERDFGLDRLDTYRRFACDVRDTKRALLQFLIEATNDGKRIAGYGAPAKGNTLLNYCGIRTDFIDYTVDRNPHKQGLFLPGTHIPIRAPEALAETRPDYVLILPWNLRQEITTQMAHIADWGGRFVVPIPRVEVLG